MKTSSNKPIVQSGPQSVGIIHPEPLTRHLLYLAFQHTLEMDVQFTAPTIQEIPDNCKQFDVLFMHVDDPNWDGEDIVITSYWQVRFPGCKVMLLGPTPSYEELRSLIQVGINGYMVRDKVEFNELYTAIDNMWPDGPGLCPTAQQIMAQARPPKAYFTPREQQLIVLLRKLGTRHRKEAASQMRIQYSTYTEYVRRICNKLGVAGIDDILGACDRVTTTG